jgi:hypothetical protein
MRRRLRSRATLENALATAAACLAIAGAAYAANYTVRGSDVINGSLTGQDVQDNSLTGADLKGLGSNEVSELTETDLEAGTLPKGPDGDAGSRGWRGPKGFQGDRGERGPTGYQGSTGQKGYRGYAGFTGDTGSAVGVVVRPGAPASLDASGATAEASCDVGERAVGGGGIASGRARIYRSAPTPLPRFGLRGGPTGWEVSAVNDSSRLRASLTPYVICFP